VCVNLEGKIFWGIWQSRGTDILDTKALHEMISLSANIFVSLAIGIEVQV